MILSFWRFLCLLLCNSELGRKFVLIFVWIITIQVYIAACTVKDCGLLHVLYTVVLCKILLLSQIKHNLIASIRICTIYIDLHPMSQISKLPS